MTNCPGCGAETAPDDVTWPIEVEGKVMEGGCQNCWEADCARSWWEALPLMLAMVPPPPELDDDGGPL